MFSHDVLVTEFTVRALSRTDGCWFLLARGSGIFVSTAKALSYRGTAEADASGLGHDEGRYPVDLCYAKVTARRGFDSLQVRHICEGAVARVMSDCLGAWY